ncbi:hypothetical protein D018_1765A, partial [Vibrio parahaemolyticus VP2007-007]|jgi:uncharacterized iron-regulated protein
MLFLD